jgi:membrane protease YdiL (CAAX protease family)
MMASQLSNWIKKHSLVAYFVLAFLITWTFILPLVLSALNLLPFKVSEHWHSLGALGPICAALIVTASVGGKAGISEFLSRLTRWKVGTFWIFVSVFSPFVMFLLSALIVRVSGNASLDFGKLASGEYTTFAWLVGLLLPAIAYGIGEEAGWRGFALPRLQHGHNALWATFLLSVFWALWHIPMFFYRFDFSIGMVSGFFIGLFAGALWMTFLYNSTGGSTLMVALWHTTWNIVNVIGLDVSIDVVSWMSGMVMVAAVIVVLVGKPAQLSLHGKHTL